MRTLKLTQDTQKNILESLLKKHCRYNFCCIHTRILHENE